MVLGVVLNDLAIGDGFFNLLAPKTPGDPLLRSVEGMAVAAFSDRPGDRGHGLLQAVAHVNSGSLLS
jgi:hypothetical protein